jgi:hypothetical protein
MCYLMPGVFDESGRVFEQGAVRLEEAHSLLQVPSRYTSLSWGQIGLPLVQPLNCLEKDLKFPQEHQEEVS